MIVFVRAQYQWLMVSPFTLQIYSYKFKKMEGNFQRTGGLQAGIDLVEVGNLILSIKVLHVSDILLLWSYNGWMECFHFWTFSSGWKQYFVPVWPAPLLSCEYYKQYTKILYWGKNGLCSSCDEARLCCFPKSPKWYWSPVLIRVSRIQQSFARLTIKQVEKTLRFRDYNIIDFVFVKLNLPLQGSVSCQQCSLKWLLCWTKT